MDIVEELRRDRENGAKRLVSEYKAGLMTLARRFLVNESDAEELVNATFAKVVANIDTYLEQSAFFAWMCQILTNEFRDSVRRKSRKMEVCPDALPDMAARFVVSGRLALAESGEFALGGQNQPYWTELRAGSFTLDGAARAMVTAGPLGGARTFATGSGFVNVAETISVGGASTLFLVCDGYTGGPVVCRAGRFAVGPAATVSANYYGFCFHIAKSPQTCAGTGRGHSYRSGPAHGGYGSGSNNRDIGVPYDYPYGPVMPGACVSSPNGGLVANSTPGSGVIRVHARHVRIEGTVTAEQPHKASDTATGYGLYNNSIYSAGAGGTIWITSSGPLRVRPGATIVARGQQSQSGYGAAGGGRISLGRGLTADDVAALVTDGTAVPARTSGKPIEAKDAAAFAGEYPNALVSVAPNGSGGEGTFWFLDGGSIEPTLLILR